MNFVETIISFNKLSDFAELLPLLFFIMRRVRILLYPYLFSELLIHQVLDISTVILSSYKIYNLYIYHLIGFFELVLIFYFYKRISTIPRYLEVTFYVIVILYLINSLFIEPIFDPTVINSLGRSLSVLFLLTLGFNYLYQLYRKEETENIHTIPDFWFNAGFMIYFSASLFTFLFSNKILSLPLESYFSAGWVLHTFADILRCIIIAVGLNLVKENKELKISLRPK